MKWNCCSSLDSGKLFLMLTQFSRWGPLMEECRRVVIHQIFFNIEQIIFLSRYRPSLWLWNFHRFLTFESFHGILVGFWKLVSPSGDSSRSLHDHLVQLMGSSLLSHRKLSIFLLHVHRSIENAVDCSTWRIVLLFLHVLLFINRVHPWVECVDCLKFLRIGRDSGR